MARTKAPRTCTSERRDAARLPAAGNAPGSSARAAAHSCVRPALAGSASCAAAHVPGARAPRSGPARSLRVGGQPVGAAAELALRGPTVSGAALAPGSRASALNPFHPQGAEAQGAEGLLAVNRGPRQLLHRARGASSNETPLHLVGMTC